MRLLKIGFLILCTVLLTLSCNNDDEGVNVEPLRDRTEQQKDDDTAITEYLNTHYYNSSMFGESNPDSRLEDLVITKLEENESVPEGSKLLSEAVEKKDAVFAETNYSYYILKLHQGKGQSIPNLIDAPKFSDNIRVKYTGNLLNEIIFDNNNASFSTNFDMLGLAVEGWRLVFPEFNAAMLPEVSSDGTVSYDKPGVGVMFVPSGLAYFNAIQNSIPAYSPLIFKFELLQYFENDHDGDGIPSYLEDLDGDGVFSVLDIDDNTDGDSEPNVNDVDDDGDGILTKDEISVTTTGKLDSRQEVLEYPLTTNQVLTNKILEEKDQATGEIKYTGTIITFPDTDEDGIADYLDAD